MEAAGVEPASESTAARNSTCLSASVFSARREEAAKNRRAPASEKSHRRTPRLPYNCVRSMKKARVLVLTAVGIVSSLSRPPALSAVEGRTQQATPTAEPIALKPTNHPRLPADLSQLWFAPATRPTAAS